MASSSSSRPTGGASHNTGTFQPLRHRSGTLRDRLHGYTRQTLGAGGSLDDAVALPPGESCAGWVAVHAVDFYNDVSTIWAVMAEDPYLDSFRPGEGFPSGVEYRWSEPVSSSTSTTTTTTANAAANVAGGGGEQQSQLQQQQQQQQPSSSQQPQQQQQHQQTVSVSAPVYVERVLQWIADQINDETKFPDDDDEAEALRVFQTPAFAALCGQIFRRLFRVYGIIYSSFFGTLEALQMAPHLNTCFKHFMFFCTEFGLLPEREMEPLEVLVKPIRKQYHLSKGGK